MMMKMVAEVEVEVVVVDDDNNVVVHLFVFEHIV
jgi:hypothetical protein